MIRITTVDQLELDAARVFYRVDYNVPLDESGNVSDSTRIDETMPTLLMLRERGAKIILGAHFGRPKGTVNPKYSLKPVLEKLREITNLPIRWADDCAGEDAVRQAEEMKPGEILLLENLRFHAGEEKNDPEFAKKLRRLAEFYVNDAFGASHRAHASIVALPELFDEQHRAGGLLLTKELDFLQKITDVEERPFVAILGGAKIAGKIEPLEAMVKLADSILIGGGMANTFLAAQNVAMGSSLVDKESLPVAQKILGGSARAEVVLPVDLVVTNSFDAPTEVRTVDVSSGVPDGYLAVDIGPKSIARYSDVLSRAKTIFWNGPMGVFEKEQFATGTKELARAVATADAVTVVGGGESVEAIKESGYADRIKHISTGGGASLEFISGVDLPGIQVLRMRNA